MMEKNHETAHYKLEVTGRVQGVGFRYTAQNEALRLGITGVVKNRPNGSVYLEIEGPPAKLDAMINWCNTGPAMARVDGLQVYPGEVKGHQGFTIR